MDQVDRVAGRVSLAALTGLVGGAAIATYKGHPLPKTCISTAVSFALVGTACFGFERLSTVVIRQLTMAPSSQEDPNTEQVFYASHALGGMIGGGITGALFQHRPIPGMMLCTPLMIGVAYAELCFEKERKERLRQLLLTTNNEKCNDDTSDSEDNIESKE